MFGVAPLTDRMVRTAVAGPGQERSRVLETVAEQVSLMVFVRLVPTAAQRDDADDIAQDVMAALTKGLPNLETQTVLGLKAYTSNTTAQSKLKKPAGRVR